MAGFIEVITGPMFAGKTEEFMRRIRRCNYAKQSVLVVKPSCDDRYDPDNICSHNGNKMKSLAVSNTAQIIKHLRGHEVIAIDEINFFKDDLIYVVQKLAGQGKRVILAGLDKDYRGEPFGILPQILAIADKVDKLTAICVACGDEASMTLKKDVPGATSQILQVGAADIYEARCRKCHTLSE
jgi:thymidine kinase